MHTRRKGNEWESTRVEFSRSKNQIPVAMSSYRTFAATEIDSNDPSSNTEANIERERGRYLELLSSEFFVDVDYVCSLRRIRND